MKKLSGASLIALVTMGNSYAITFEGETISGSFDSTITAGVGVRTMSPACDLIATGATGTDAPAGCLGTMSGLGDQGTLNYKAGQPFTAYLKGTHELLLSGPDDWKFMGRVAWRKDGAATRTTGNGSGTNPAGVPSLTDEASNELNTKTRVLDLWVSKKFELNEQQARIRVGNQVVSWGESIYIPGGVNQTNALDVMQAAQPGTQLKEVFIPAPIASFATGLGHGVNMELYVQSEWNASYLPPTGSYWSTANGLGAGADAYGITTVKPRTDNQHGISLKWQPQETPVNLGFYYISYQDKTPQTGFSATQSNPSTGLPIQQWVYAQDRKMYGVSANFQAGNWALGTELSYRPKEAVALNPVDCLQSSPIGAGLLGQTATNNGECWVDREKYQLHLTGIWSITQADYPKFLKVLGGADNATLVLEAVGIKFPGLQSSYNGSAVAAGGWGWGFESTTASPAITGGSDVGRPVGTEFSWGYNLNLSWNYDGTLIPGWRVTPEIYYFEAVSGRTPTNAGTFMEGAKSMNVAVTFAQNPTRWVYGFNYSHFWGGSNAFDQPMKGHDFFGAYASRNF